MLKINGQLSAFTLAEVLITLGVIGVVAAVTMPTIVTNIQEKVRKEQVRTVKYKLTKATDKMNSLGKIGDYGDDEDATSKFVDELKKHLSIVKVCDNNHLAECWNGSSFTNYDGSTTYTVSDLKTGQKLEALQPNSPATKTMGIVTSDGTPIILVYGKDCQALDETKQYTWSTVDGKPETNATAGCVSMVFDINGKKGPNKIGTDVRTMNSLLGMIDLGPLSKTLTKTECNNLKAKLGINHCPYENDYWAAATKECYEKGMHLPSMQLLAQIATVQLGVQVDPFEFVATGEACNSSPNANCKIKTTDYSTSISTPLYGNYYSSQEADLYRAYTRSFNGSISGWTNHARYGNFYVVCMAD